MVTKGECWGVCAQSFNRVWPFAIPWTVAHQTPLCVEFFRQEYWSGLPFPSPGDLPNPEIEPGFSALEADALTSKPPGKPRERIDTCIFVTESLCCTPETGTIVLIDDSLI